MLLILFEKMSRGKLLKIEPEPHCIQKSCSEVQSPKPLLVHPKLTLKIDSIYFNCFAKRDASSLLKKAIICS